MNTVWCKAWPDVIHDFRRFDVIPGLQQDIVRLAHNVGLEEVDGDNVGELLGSHNEKLAKEYLMELDEQWASEENADDGKQQAARTLTTNDLSRLLGPHSGSSRDH